MKILTTIFFIIIFTFTSIYPQNGIVKEYYDNGYVKSEINFVDGVRDGDAKLYYENGNLKKELTYVNGKVDGLVQIYSDSGKIAETYLIQDGKREGPTSLFDSTGTYLTDIYFEGGKLIRDENPFKIDYPQNDSLIAENNPEVKEEKKEESKTKVREKVYQYDFPLPPEVKDKEMEDDPAFYTNVEVMPKPAGGMESVYRKLHYPEEAKKNNIEGTVEVLAFIDKYGEVVDAKVEKGIGHGCDDAARLAVYYTKFEPGLQRGKPVKVQMIVPVEFKMNE